MICTKKSTQTLFMSNNSQINNLCSKRGLVNTGITSISFSSKPRINTWKPPYLHNNEFQILSQVTARRLAHRRETNTFSSYPSALKIYKANSDELAQTKINKNNKKSILTLPNESNALLQTGTASDMNEYVFKEEKKKNNSRKLLRTPSNRKNQKKKTGFYNKNELYSSQLDIDLGYSSASLKEFDGYCGIPSNKLLMTQKTKCSKNKPNKLNAHDVWAMLRNMNRFQFLPSPPISEESATIITKNKGHKQNMSHNRKRSNVVKSCRTEEFTYISSVTHDKKSSTLSVATSIDRLTVIEQQDPINAICDKIKRPDQDNIFFVDKINDAIPNATNKDAMVLKKNKLLDSRRTKRKRLPPKNKKKPKLPKCEEDKKQFNTAQKDQSGDKIITAHSRTNLINQNEIKNIRYRHVCQEMMTESNDCFVDSTTSGSSKAYQNNLREAKSNNRKGLIKLKLSEKENSIQKQEKRLSQPIITKKKPRLVTTMPSSSVAPKLTRNDIKRQLAQIRFPLVVLGKDQLSSLVEVINYDPPQLRGLNEHVWPYMLEWNSEYQSKTNNNSARHAKINNKEPLNSRKSNEIVEVCNVKLNNATLEQKYQHQLKTIQYSKRFPPQPNTIKSKKPNLEKNFKYVHKNLSVPKIPTRKTDNRPLNQKQGDIVNTEKGNLCLKKYLSVSCQRQNIRNNNTSHERRTENCCWARSIPSNYFVENVIKNIDSGIYYNLDNQICDSCTRTDIKQNLTQMSLNADSVNTQSSVTTDTMNTHTSATDNSVYMDGSQHPRKINKETSVTVDTINIHKLIAESVTNTESSLTSEKINSRFLIYDNSNEDLSLGLAKEMIATSTSGTLEVIPGFDDTLPAVEVTTIDINRVAVKIRENNIVVQFNVVIHSQIDVIMPKISLSCLPETFINNEIKLVHYETSVTNSVLPAELCSILPKIMQDIINTNKAPTDKSILTNKENILPKSKLSSSVLLNKEDSTRSPCVQSESFITFLPNEKTSIILFEAEPEPSTSVCKLLNETSSFSAFGRSASRLNGRKSLATLSITELNERTVAHCLDSYSLLSQNSLLIDGTFSKFLPFSQQLNHKNHNKEVVTITYIDLLFLNLLPILINILPTNLKIPDLIPTNLIAPLNDLKCYKNNFPCMTVDTYLTNNRRMIPSFNKITLKQMFNKIKIYNSLYLNNVPPLTTKLKLNADAVNPLKLSEDAENALVHLRFKNQKIKDKQHKIKNISMIVKIIDYIDSPVSIHENKDNKMNIKGPLDAEFNRFKNKKKIIEKNEIVICKKSKSTSNISGLNNTLLDNITNMDDFFQSLGSCQELSNLFDVETENKILSCVIEMKNWISEISPTQTMLILLLTNKKDYPSLVKFRSVILQGIAVNRITRASELDMEIDIVEKEDFNEFSQYEGISYIPASPASYDNLLEELLRIAKKSASECQKPFDEISERLLKSFLQKRKTFNPSYLRVMARYVGLGLLKPTLNRKEYV